MALVWYRPRWKSAYLLLLVGFAIDLDHLWANPIYDPTRCSIGYHPLHGAVAIGCYALLAAFSKTRLLGLGLLVHMALDALDCVVLGWV